MPRNGYHSVDFGGGDKYEGQYVEGKFHGQGTLTYANGNKYEGEYVEDKMHGQGTLTFGNPELAAKYGLPVGTVYRGQFRDGKRHGHGTHTYPDSGRVTEVEWKDNKLVHEKDTAQVPLSLPFLHSCLSASHRQKKKNPGEKLPPVLL